MSMLPRTVSLAALALCACQSGGGAGPIDAPVPRPERDDGRAVVCVVDARTGRPVVGARLAAVPEVATPRAHTWWEARSSVSDRDGIARLGLADLLDDPWLVVTAPGYAPFAEHTCDLGPRLELQPAVDREIQVRDPFEDPLQGAALSWFVGCGHTPDVAWATTDAAGRARLEGIARDPSAGDLWVAGPTLATDYGYAPQYGPVLVRVRPGVAARGRVVDADGKPVAGVFVGAPLRHHGPWTTTDREGAFELPGVAPPVEVTVLSEPDLQARMGFFEIPMDGRAVTLRVPLEREPVTRPVELELRSREGHQPLSGLTVEFVRDSDGLTRRVNTDAQGRIELDLPPGEWLRSVGGGFSGWRLATRSFTIADGPVVETLTLEAQPRWHLALAEPHPDARVELVSDLDVHRLTGDELAGAFVPVPVEGRCAVRVELHDRVRVVELDRSTRRERSELRLELPEPLLLRARLLDAEAVRVRGVLWVGTGDPPAWPEGREQASDLPRLSTWHAVADLWVLPAEERFQPRRLSRSLPWQLDRIDLGAIVLEPPGARRVQLLDAEGAPLVGAEVVHFAPLGRHTLTTGSDGGFESTAFPAAAGDLLAVRPADGGPTFHATLDGPAPWTVQRPDTRVAFEVAGDEGAPLASFQVVVAGEVFAGASGRIEIVGLDPGRHVAFVTADGHAAWRQPLEVVAGEVLAVRAVLPLR